MTCEIVSQTIPVNVLIGPRTFARTMSMGVPGKIATIPKGGSIQLSVFGKNVLKPRKIICDGVHFLHFMPKMNSITMSFLDNIPNTHFSKNV